MARIAAHAEIIPGGDRQCIVRYSLLLPPPFGFGGPRHYFFGDNSTFKQVPPAKTRTNLVSVFPSPCRLARTRASFVTARRRRRRITNEKVVARRKKTGRGRDRAEEGGRGGGGTERLGWGVGGGGRTRPGSLCVAYRS